MGRRYTGRSDTVAVGARAIQREALQPPTSTIPGASMPQKAGEDLCGASQQPWEHAHCTFLKALPSPQQSLFRILERIVRWLVPWGCNHHGALTQAAAACKAACWIIWGGGSMQQVLLACMVGFYPPALTFPHGRGKKIV